MTEYEFFLSSSLQKVFPQRRPEPLPSGASLSLWQGTRGAVQLVYQRRDCLGEMPHQWFRLEVLGSPSPCRIRKVQLIPSEYPCYGAVDPYYITTEPGLFPDLLEDVEGDQILPLTNQYRSLWLSWDVPEDTAPGSYDITVRLTAVESQTVASGLVYADPSMAGFSQDLHLTLHIGQRLPKQQLIHTEWFHADCLANYYHTEMYDERHWQVVENFMAAAQRHGVNMLLTPVLTPPLDTAKNGSRRSSQLVKIAITDGNYSFDFSNLDRWVALCRKYGMDYLEIAHFFTQWGAQFTPNIVATVDGVEQRIFGWDHPATGDDYRAFLQTFIPQLRARLESLGYDEQHVFYHVSDEPSPIHLQSYQAARDVVKDLIPVDQIVDALSSVEFYKKGIVPHPIPGSSEVDDFYAEKIPDLWVYYCCAQCHDVPNRLFAQESACTRMMGVLMYLYNIRGFLHWGFNFYNTKFSGRPINPFMVTHADYGFPSGDAYLVYPGDDGQAMDSLRAEVQDEGLLDYRALELLEELVGREQVEELIYQDIPKTPLTFTSFPRNPQWLLDLRERVAAALRRCQEC